MLYQQNVFFCLFLGGFHCVNGKKNVEDFWSVITSLKKKGKKLSPHSIKNYVWIAITFTGSILKIVHRARKGSVAFVSSR